MARWKLADAATYGLLATHRRSPVLRIVGSQEPINKALRTQGATRRRTCESCRQQWVSAYQVSAPHHITLRLIDRIDTVYVCPKCRGHGGLIIIPGKGHNMNYQIQFYSCAAMLGVVLGAVRKVLAGRMSTRIAAAVLAVLAAAVMVCPPAHADPLCDAPGLPPCAPGAPFTLTPAQQCAVIMWRSWVPCNWWGVRVPEGTPGSVG